MNKFSKSQIFFLILILGLIGRILAIYIYADNSLENEWAIILHNYKVSGVFGYNVVIDKFSAVPKFAELGEKVLPTVFMPPLYYQFIFLIDKINNDFFKIANLIIYTQLIFSIFSIYIFYKLLNAINVSNNKENLFLTLFFALFPLNVYAPSQISSISLQIFLLLIFFYSLIKLVNFDNTQFLIVFSIFSGLLILIRGEFLLFYLFTLIFFFSFYKKNFKVIIGSLFIILLIISPYLYRNFENFGSLTLTKSFGYNLLKGNNIEFKVEGNAEFIEKNYPRKELKIKTSNNYEIELDNFYKDKALVFIKENPKEFILSYIFKSLSFLLIDFKSSYPNYYNFLHVAPKFLLGLSSFFGAIVSLQRRSFYQYLSIYYFLNIFLFSLFFILPRYSLILLPVQLILSLNFYKFLKKKLSD